MSAERPRTRRLLIAASNLADAEAALPLARSILEWSPATPRGLLVETGTADLVMGGGHRVVSASGALLAVPSREQSGRIAKIEARALERHLASLAAGLATDWACEAAAGELVASACAAVVEEDILLLGQRPMLRQRGNVLLLGAGGGVSAASRALAEALARATRSAIAELGSGEADLLARVDRSHATVVVADFEAGPLRSEQELRRLVAAARCPVAVLGASRIRRAGPSGSGRA